MKYDRVLVTGGAGFIGSHLVEGLLRCGIEVIVLDDLSVGRTSNLSRCMGSRRLKFVRGDIREREAVKDSLKDVKAVFHLAALTSVPYSVEHPEVTHEVNVEGTKRLLEACLDSMVERFIYVSSCAVYGEPRYLPVDEEHPLAPLSPYAHSKRVAEQVCFEFQETYGLKVTVLRPFNVYGSRQRGGQYGGVVTKFIERLFAGKPPIIYGDGTQTRDFIYVKDAVTAFILTLKSPHAVGKTFNVATGKPTSINRLAQLLADLLNVKNVKPIYAEPRQGDIKHSYADITRIRTCLGFEPQTSLKKGLSTLIESWREIHD
ncbi:SDR family oxidoreductase [Candidatus Bathyarchaeota archaeon]|nr:MAG: SDR family oxidoreductase [Candidatus Bathyarchaeota archaeon]RLG98472.1 MAG: hypothetical protein DRO28_02580 [Candidatus Bathyarchaeota archaeon]